MQPSVFAGFVGFCAGLFLVFGNANALPWFPATKYVHAEMIMSKADANGDGILTLKEANDYLELYGLQDIALGSFDTNEDGNLTVTEINHGVAPEELLHADKNHDGLVSLYEGTLFMSEHGVHVQKKDLKKFDDDNDSCLSVREVNQIPQKLFATPIDKVLRVNLQEGLTNTSNAEIFKYADLNNDGRLSLIELATSLTEHGNYQVNAFDLMKIDLNHDAYISVDEIEEFRE